jgi:hypothetical protein
MSMIQRVANSRKLLLEFRQWLPGLLRVKADDFDGMSEIKLLDEVVEEIEEMDDRFDYEYGSIRGTHGGVSTVAWIEYKGKAELKVRPKDYPEAIHSRDFRILNPKTGRPQVKHIEKFFESFLPESESLISAVNDQTSYVSFNDPQDFSVKVLRVIPKRDEVVFILHLSFWTESEEVEGYEDDYDDFDWYAYKYGE